MKKLSDIVSGRGFRDTGEQIRKLEARAEAAEAKYARLVERLRKILEREKITVIGNHKIDVMPTLLTKDIEAAIKESDAPAPPEEER